MIQKIAENTINKIHSQEEPLYKLVIREAFNIAKNDLDSLYSGTGIMAGKMHFDDYWARDSFFASWGYIATGDFQKAKNNLDLFLSFQDKKGLIPRRIDRFYATRFKYFFGIRIRRPKLRPVYNGRFRFPNIDPNSIFLITAKKYFSASHDKNWLEENIVKINKAVFWLKDQDLDRNGLIEEGALANWMDTVVKFKGKGETLYSNILAWAAIGAAENLNHQIGRDFFKELSDYKRELERKINDYFWNGEYFSDWYKNGKRFDYFAADGNILAIILGFANDNQAKNILISLKKYFGKEPVPMPVNYPAYPKKYLALRHALSGLPGYHNAYGRWLWIASLSALAHKICKDKTRFLQEISVMSDWIVKNKRVFEVYKPDGTPFNRPFWKSECPFAWNSGIFMWVVKELNLI